MKFIKSTKGAWRGFLGAMLAIVALNLLSEQFPLPDNYEDLMRQLTHRWIGIISIALICPILEELIFRLAICGGMLHFHVRPWIAIMVSAICFGIAHWNPAQTPFAIGMGLVMGLLYWRNGLWLSILVHVTNNSVALLEEYALGDRFQGFTMTDAIGGPVVAWTVIVIMAAASIKLLRN